MTKPKTKNQNNIYFMHGAHPVISAVKNHNRNILSIHYNKKYHDDILSIINLRTDKNNIKLNISSNSQIEKILNNDSLNHQGIIAKVKPIYKNSFPINSANTTEKILILDQLQDSHNIGAIIRSANAFGFNQIICINNNMPSENATIAKTAAGTLESTKLFYINNLNQLISNLKKNDFWIAGLSVRGKNSISEITNIPKLAIIIGSENKGLRKLTEEKCDFTIKINIAPNVESLNASNAAAILMHNISNPS